MAIDKFFLPSYFLRVKKTIGTYLLKVLIGPTKIRNMNVKPPLLPVIKRGYTR